MENSNTAGGRIPHAARRLAVSIPTTYRLIAEGKLRSYKIGRAHRVSDLAIADCIALLEQQHAESRKAG